MSDARYGDNGYVISVRLPEEILTKLDRVVAMERAQARPGHKVGRSSLITLAITDYVSQRLRRVPRATSVTP